MISAGCSLPRAGPRVLPPVAGRRLWPATIGCEAGGSAARDADVWPGKISAEEPSGPTRRAGGGQRSGVWRPLIAGVCVSLVAAVPAGAQSLTIDLGASATTERALQLVALITILSLAPSALVVVTCFTRLVVVLSILRSALGTQTAPPNAVLVALALFLTAFVMAPTGRQAYANGIQPLLAGEISQEQALTRALSPFRAFMLRQVRENDLDLFLTLSRAPAPATPAEIGLEVIMPAFMISELRRAFEIGFLLFVPFLIIDLAVSSILIALGMVMMPPSSVALPFKLIFFVLVDGWSLLIGSLVESFSR